MVSWRTLALFPCLVLGSRLAGAATEDGQLILQQHTQSLGKRPNIIFILTDDQDARLDSLSYMPHLQEHLIQHGTLFQRHYCTVALCCPSRVNLWTGKAAHNTNVTDVNPPYGQHMGTKLCTSSRTSLANSAQEATRNSSARASTMRGCLSGSSALGITLTTLESCSMPILSTIMTLLSQPASQALTFSWTPLPINTSMRHSSGIGIPLSATRAIIPLTFWLKRRTGCLRKR